LLPAPKPRPAAPTAALARLVPPHRLVAPRPAAPALLRPEERLHIVPPTRPDWLPPPAPRKPPAPPPPHRPPAPWGAGVRPRPFPPALGEPRTRNAGRFAGQVNGARGRGPAAVAHSGGGGRSGSQKPKAAAAAAVRKEKKAWVAVEKKGEDAGD